jgi:hypothetical protein
MVRPESVGRTLASRMIHAESGQLFIGPYAIGLQRNVRVIPYREFDRRGANLAQTAKRAAISSFEVDRQATVISSA